VEAPVEPPKPTAPPIGEQPMAAAPPEVGTIFRGRVAAVSESGHIALLNRAVDRSVAKATLRAAQDQRARVEGLIYGFNRGGFDVLVEGIRAFCPASGMSLGHVEDPHEYLGRKVEFTVPPSKGGKSIVVSRRAVLEKELRKAAKERLKNLAIGEDLEGTITQVRDYGLLVDIGEGVEGLVHQSEVSWSRGVRPGDVGKPGDRVKVRVLRVQPMTRKERHGRVSLSLRACQPDPWDAHADVVREGHAQKATVVRTTEFGAFMKLAPGVEGLLHISELGGKDLKHAKLAVEEGEELAVIVERVDREQRRISLSRLSQADAEKLDSGELDPQAFARPPRQGAHVFVIIERVEHHGIVAQVEGVAGRRGRAYIPNRELADEGGDRKRTYAAGSKVEVKVLSVDRDGQLRCSVRARLQDEERKAVKEYRKEAARQGFGTFGDLLRAKLGGDSSS
jgi:small subunit ribosomal protein S1